MRTRKGAIVGIIALAGAVAIGGCAEGKAHPHPALEMQHEEQVAHQICKYPRSMAEEAGKDALETYVIVCE